MRIVSYNILDGGEGRADPLGEIIEAQRPDVVGLVEADNLAVVERIANRLGMDFVHAVGNKHASALLSRFPIRESVNHAPRQPRLQNSLLEATVVDAVGRPWVFGVLHLHAHAAEADEQRREEELAVVLDVFASRRQNGEPHVLMGDFNSNSPVQRIDPEKLKPSSRTEWDENGGRIPRRVVQKLLDAGYVDSLQAVDATAAAASGSFSTQHPGQRVDYILAHGIDLARLRAAWIEHDRLAQFASDHFPIGAEID